MGRFNKAAGGGGGGKRRGPNYQGRGSSRRNANTASTDTTTTNNNNKNNSRLRRRNVIPSSSKRVIDQIQNRMTQQQQQQQDYQAANGARTATTEQALKYLDKSKLDEITISTETQALIASLLQNLGVVQSNDITAPIDVDGNGSLDEDGGDCHSQDDEGSFDSQDELTEDMQDVWQEQSDARRAAGRTHFEDYQEDMDIDSDGVIFIRKDYSDDDEYAEETSEPDDVQDTDRSIAEEERTVDQDGLHGTDENSLENNRAFLHLIHQLSFSREQASRACKAIDGWDEAAVADEPSKLSSKPKIRNNKDDYMLELAMDWLCLHLNEDELSRGFRPNPNPPKQQQQQQQQQQSTSGVINKVKAVPHPSISVISKPIAEQAKEWAESLRLQERTISLVRLGFHHSEALQACDETSKQHHPNKSPSLTHNDPAIPLLLQKLAIEAQRGTEIDTTPDAESFGEELLETLKEERAQEVEALEAIYEEQLEVSYTPNPEVNQTTNGKSTDVISRYDIAIKPLEPLKSPARTEDCTLHVFIRDGYPLQTYPLPLFVNTSLPPTFLRRINAKLIEKALELLGNPVVFEIVSFLEAELPTLYDEFVEEQRIKEYEAEQVRLLRQRHAEMEETQKIMEAQYQAQYDPTGEGAKLGRRQKAKLRAAEKAYDRPDQVEQLFKEYRRKQDARVEQAKQQNSQVRATYAQLAIEKRQQELIQEEAEKAARTAMSAALNRGESVEEARMAAQAARVQSLRENGVEICDPHKDISQKIAHTESNGSRNCGTRERNIHGHVNRQPKSTSKSSMFMDRLRNSVGGSEPQNYSVASNSGSTSSLNVDIDSTPVLTKPRPTEQSSAFMDRLREMYENAAKEKLSSKCTADADPGREEINCFHLDAACIKSEMEDPSSKVPRPVAVAAGEMGEVIKDIIQQQEEQPWLVSAEARAPTLIEGRKEVTSFEVERKRMINIRLRQDLERKRQLASEWGDRKAETHHGNDKNLKKSKAFPHEMFYHLMKQRESLPAYMMEKELVETIRSNQITVVAGATGCGKTTQVPQLVLDSLILNDEGASANIIVTQPRRISAVGVSERIAQERCEKVGDTCGYSIKLEKKVSAKTRLLLCTTGILLRRLQCDPDLASVSHIFVDEVHERDLNTDFLLIILKDLLARRKELKLILMSATLNADSFSDFFGGCPIVSIPGRAFPVVENRLEDVLELTGYKVQVGSDYAQKTNETKPPKISKSALRRLYYPRYSKETIHSLSIVDETVINYELLSELLQHICINQVEGAILVFCPGFQEIQKTIEELYKKEYFQSSNVVIYPLHSTLSTAEQSAIFEVPASGVRKIVVSTNIAETSITIEDVVFVVDTGRVKENRRDEVNETPTLEECWVSRASAKQRRGRAGRVRPGIAYHLFSTHTHDSDLQEYQLPEMLRVGIEDLVLQILVLDLGEPTAFLKKALDPPSDLALSNSLKMLEQLGAIYCHWQQNVRFADPKPADKDSEETSLRVNSELTALGFHLATLPVDPRVGKMIIYSSMLGCVDPLMTLAASMSARSPFVSPFSQREQADEARRKFSDETGSDHLTILNAFNQWTEMRLSKGNNRAVQVFLKDNFLGRLTLFQMEDLRRQFRSLLVDIGFLSSDFRLNDLNHASNANSNNIGLIRAVLCAGLYPNVIVAPKSVISSAPPRPSDKKMGEVPFRSRTKGEVFLHPSTIAFEELRLDSRYCCYHELVRTSKTYVRDCTTISPLALLLFGGALEVYQSHGVCSVDGWLKFRIDAKPATLIKYLRNNMERMLLEKILHPQQDVMATKEGKALIDSISRLFESEEASTAHPTTSQNDGISKIVHPWTAYEDEPGTSGNNSHRSGHGDRQGTGRGRGRQGRVRSNRGRGRR
ncbi:ATP-dependent helicase HrpA [Nitzschia inconspicua]|uniref:ATP-dependent helicase HrpA n=1 Tax=Nitzschia inconspicua TaxID=303405 RepID=A0A9K3KJQ0_9STRA|nr:ATP-dependent helicase HrpA [Nitzschia inconspicua]